MSELGYDKLAVSRLMALRSQGVTPEYVRELEGAGYEGLPPPMLIAPALAKESLRSSSGAEEAASTKLKPEELMELRSQGVRAELLNAAAGPPVKRGATMASGTAHGCRPSSGVCLGGGDAGDWHWRRRRRPAVCAACGRPSAPHGASRRKAPRLSSALAPLRGGARRVELVAPGAPGELAGLDSRLHRRPSADVRFDWGATRARSAFEGRSRRAPGRALPNVHLQRGYIADMRRRGYADIDDEWRWPLSSTT